MILQPYVTPKAHLGGIMLLLQMSTFGQVVNGSFEQDGEFSTEGWQSNSYAPYGVQDAPAVGGSWSLSPPPPTYSSGEFNVIYQWLPWLQNGDVIEFRAWIKSIHPTSGPSACGSAGACITIRNGLMGSAFISECSESQDWMLVSFDGPIFIYGSDTAQIELSAYANWGPSISGLAGLVDAVSLVIRDPVGLPTLSVPSLSTRMDNGASVLLVSAGDTQIQGLTCFAVNGQRVSTNIERSSPTIWKVDVAGLTQGIYLLHAMTDRGITSHRFLVP